MSKRAQRQAKEDWEKEKATITSCKKKEEFYVPHDHEFDDLVHNARRTLESRSESVMLCKSYLLKNVSNTKKDDFERVGGHLANEFNL